MADVQPATDETVRLLSDKCQYYIESGWSGDEMDFDTHQVAAVLARLVASEARCRELEAARAWRPMETAPREIGQRVLLLDADGEVYVGLSTVYQCLRWVDGADCLRSPRFWQPLPAPPESP